MRVCGAGEERVMAGGERSGVKGSGGEVERRGRGREGGEGKRGEVRDGEGK